MNPEITKKSYKLLCSIYKIFLERTKSGQSEEQARYFENLPIGANDLKSCIELSSWNPDDIDSKLNELNKTGYIKKYIAGDFVLTDKAIILMENRFKNGIKEITSFLASFI